MDTTVIEDTCSQPLPDHKQRDERLSKRLCYILRYGAEKEGLHVYDGGFVELDKMLELHIMRHHTRAEVLNEIDISLSHRRAKRFEKKQDNGTTYVRACFCRNFEENPCHEGSNVSKLTEVCVQYICDNLNNYDLEDFPDEHLISKMIQKMKRQRKLNSMAFRQLLVPVLEHLDLDGIYITQGTLKLILRSCPNLRVLSLKDCGYIMTDSLMEQLVKNPCHEGSNVSKLTEVCVQYICDNLNNYDLEDFPDEHLISKMIQKMKRQRKLNSMAFRQLLVPVLEHLDLDGIYITQGTLKLILRSCPNLRVLSLKDCGYIMTDSLMEQLVKKLPHLESLSLCACKHLTDRSMKALAKYSKHLKELNLSWITTISENAIIDVLIKCEKLEFIDIYDHEISDKSREIITDIAKKRKIKVVLKNLTDADIAPENPCIMLPNFGKVW